MSALNLAPRQIFDSAIQLAKRLQDRGAFWWRLSSGAGISARIDEQELDKEFGPDRTDDRKSFQNVIRREVSSILEALAAGVPAAQVLANFPDGGKLDEPEERELESRVAVVRETFYSKAMQDRVSIRKTCKGPTLEEIRWDISIKKHDLSEGALADVPYATIELVLIPDREGTDVYPRFLRAMFAARHPQQLVAFDCHLEDLDAILRDLQALKQNLMRLTLSQSGNK